MAAVVAGATPWHDRLAIGAPAPSAHVAVRAQPDTAAGAAREEVRPAAAVEQHDRLATRAPQIGERHPRLGVQRLMAIAHVEHLDGRHRSPVDALRQAQPGHREHALRARRRAAEHEHRPGLRGPHLGDRAGVVARVALVLVGALVLLVDDDQAEVAQRREHGRARTDAHARLAAAQALPFVVALAERRAPSAGPPPRRRTGPEIATGPAA